MKQSTCKHCKQVFDTTETPPGWMANHSRWCNENPKRMSYNESLIKARNSRTNFKNQFSYGATVSEETKAKQRIASAGRIHTEEAKKKISDAALASKHRRLRKGVVEYNGVLLDSSWELALARRLDQLNVMWIRPSPLEWTDKNGVKHNYFPDFYLVEHDIYLDPKNPHAIQVQKEKLEVILSQYKNILIIDTLNKCKEFTV